MPKATTVKKSDEFKPKSKFDSANDKKRGESSAPALTMPWETELMEICSKQVSLSHPMLESGSVTMEYGLSPSAIPLQAGIKVMTGGAFGQVAAYDDKISDSRSIIFNAMGGEMEFAPPNMKGVDALGKLAVINLVAEKPYEGGNSPAEQAPAADLDSLPQAEEAAALDDIHSADNEASISEQPQGDVSQTEISIRTAEPLVISPIENDDFQMELDNAEYVKLKGDFDPKMKFHRTKLTYRNAVVAPEFETVSDSMGLHLPDSESMELDRDALLKNGYGNPEEYDEDYSAVDGIDICFSKEGAEIVGWNYEDDEEESLPKEDAKPTDTAEKAPANSSTVKIGEANFYLYNTESQNGNVRSAERCECYHNSFEIKLQAVSINEQGELTGSVKSINLLTNPDVKVLCESITCDSLNGIRTDTALLKRGETQYALEQVTFEKSEQIFAKSAQAEINGYPAVLHDALLKSDGSISYQSADVETVLHFGLNREDKNSRYDESARAFFTFRLGAGTIINNHFDSGFRALETASQQKSGENQIDAEKERIEKTKTVSKKKAAFKESHIETDDKRTDQKIEGDIFTDDGFLRLENARFDFQGDDAGSAAIRGTGEFRFLKIPYDISVPGKKGGQTGSHLTGMTSQKSDREEQTDFTIGQDGKINAEFDDSVELPMLKNNSETISVINTLTLNDAAVEDSVLTAKSVRLDRGLGLQQDMEDDTESETAKTLFGIGLKGTIADVGGSARLDKNDGIIGETEKKQLGQFEVSDFLGFLDVSGDYAAGTLHASLHSEEQSEKEQSKKLFGESKHITDAGLSIPIAGPLSFEFSAGTSLEIGGELSADMARNPSKSFGEEMQPNETMELGGSLDISGSASVNLSAGVAAGVSALVTNLLAADLKLNAELGAQLDTKLTGGTSLGKENGKLRQVDDLAIEGGLDATLKGALSLSSDVKFLIWKANIFTIEIGKKEIKLAQVHGTATREAGARGLKNGWHFESLELSAEAFGKKAGLALKNQKAAKSEPIQITKEAVDAIGSDAMGAWAVLEDLKREQSLNGDRAYFISKEEQAALNEKIAVTAETVRQKLEKYVSALAEYEKQLVQEEKAASQAVKTARDEQNEYRHRDEIRQVAMRQAEIGGFDLENYRQEQEQELLGEKKEPENALSRDERAKIREENKQREQNNSIVRAKNKMLRQMASADFVIARQLGIYNDAMAAAKDSYDTFAQAENMKLTAKGKDIPRENLYQMSSEMSDSDFLYKEHKFWGTGADELKRLTGFGGRGDSYFKSLYANAVNSNRGREREGFGIYRKVFRVHSDPGSAEKSQIRNMSGYDLLKIILTDRYPKGACDADGNDRSGQVIGGTPEDKLKALKYLFNENSRESLTDAFTRKALGFEKDKTKQQSMLDDSDRIYAALFDTTMQDMTAKGNVDIDEKLSELNNKLEESKEKYLQTVQKHLDAQAALVKVHAEQADCQSKLDSLKKNVAAGVSLKGESVAGAVNAVDFMEKDFQAINSGKRLMEAAAESRESLEILKKAGAAQ